MVKSISGVSSRRNILSSMEYWMKCRNRWYVRVALSSFLVCLISFSSVVHAGGPGTATEAMKDTIDRVLVVLQQEDLQGGDKKDVRLTRLVEIIRHRFDYEEMGKRTLSHEWKKLTASQQQEFVTLFERFLTKSYASNVSSYSGEKIEYLKERNKGKFAEVQTLVTSPKSQVPLDYRLLKKNDEWKVYDVVIDGVSLMKNYRGQFARILKASSFEGLLAKLSANEDQATQP